MLRPTRRMRPLLEFYYRLLPFSRIDVDDRIDLLNDAEVRALKRRESVATWTAACIGGTGVVLLYAPQWMAPHLFTRWPVTIFGATFRVPAVTLSYGLALALAEMLLLTLLHVWCVHEVAVATGFLHYDRKSDAGTRQLLLDLGLQKKDKRQLRLGIDPLEGMNRAAFLAWNVLLLAKAALSNILFKIFIQRTLGRYAVQVVQDVAGIPVFAFWNAFGTRILLRESRVVIMGQNLVAETCARAAAAVPPGCVNGELLHATLQVIAVNKRDFHSNHALLAQNICTIYDVDATAKAPPAQRFRELIAKASPEEQRLCELLVAVGLVLDGRISRRERAAIEDLQRAGWLRFDATAMKQFATDFLEGRGVEPLLAAYLPGGPALAPL
jgi:hypothetical protein